jgi:hypothetical protein
VVRPTTLRPVFVVQQDVRLAVGTIAPRPSMYVLLVRPVRIPMVWLLILEQHADVDQYHVRLAPATIAPPPSIYVLLVHLVRIPMVWLLILDPGALVDRYHVQHQLV